jgi:hypothetical protein
MPDVDGGAHGPPCHACGTYSSSGCGSEMMKFLRRMQLTACKGLDVAVAMAAAVCAAPNRWRPCQMCPPPPPDCHPRRPLCTLLLAAAWKHICIVRTGVVTAKDARKVLATALQACRRAAESAADIYHSATTCRANEALLLVK